MDVWPAIFSYRCEWDQPGFAYLRLRNRYPALGQAGDSAVMPGIFYVRQHDLGHLSDRRAYLIRVAFLRRGGRAGMRDLVPKL